MSFQITSLEEDGVRLGCYGHMQDGKKYSTHYVADGKGYRLVSPKGLITVYPKDDGTPRKASFSTSFTQDEINTANIRYFFPDGCELGLAVDNVPVTPRIQKKDDVIEIPETTTEPIVEEKCVQPEYIQCCDDAQARIVLSATKNGTSKIVLPFDTELLNSCSVSEIVEITSEQNNIELLKKLLKFAQRHKL